MHYQAPTISAQACVQASCVWDSFERQQITLWFDNYHCYINGVDPHNPDKTLNVTAVGVLHTTELLQYSTTFCPVWMLLHNVYPGLLTTLCALLGRCCKEVQSQMGLFCGPGFVHLWTMIAMLWYPSSGGPFCYHTRNAEVMLSCWSLAGG